MQVEYKNIGNVSVTLFGKTLAPGASIPLEGRLARHPAVSRLVNRGAIAANVGSAPAPAVQEPKKEEPVAKEAAPVVKEEEAPATEPDSTPSEESTSSEPASEPASEEASDEAKEETEKKSKKRRKKNK